jgi:bifunctional non-homologous end joining protein LigD
VPRRKSAPAASPPEPEAEALARYKAKRDFTRTPEPAGMAEAVEAGRLYVIQKHAARRLHYDLRLQLGSILKSWAVTRGPSLTPGERRLAVHVEDHPLDYASFEGVIPAGQYGGGTVMVWDTGTWEPMEDPELGLSKGHLRFRLQGKKLKGEWLLVRMGGKPREKQEPWLLLKHRDEFADGELPDDDMSVLTGRSMAEIASAKDPVWKTRGEQTEKKAGRARKAKAKQPLPEPPDFVPPQLATLVKEAPSGQEWLHEVKHDGYRCQLRLAGGEARVLTRNGHDWTARFRALAEAARDLSPSALIDGEAVVLDAQGISSFARLKNALGDGPPAPIHFYAFDLLFEGGEDLRELPLSLRKQRLEALLGNAGKGSSLRYSDHVLGSGPEMWTQACRLGAEGIIAKRADAPYRSGRTKSWLKVKCTGRQEVVIGGYTPQKGTSGGLGALLTGVRDDGKLTFAGKVGTGWDRAEAERLLAAMEPLRQPASPFAAVPPDARRGARWLRPELVAEIRFADWTPDGRLRHASYQGLREDRDAATVTREQPAAPPRPSAGPLTVAGVRISHADRLVIADPPVSKGDLARYYEAVAPRLLPEIAGRPLSLIRCPSTLNEGCFYQRHRTAGMPDTIRPVMAQRGARDPEPYFAVDTLEGLIALVQFGGVELHPWGCRADRPDRPDRLVFDLDPAPDLPWPRVIEAAHDLRQRLAALKLQSFPKTTGGKGLHLVVPIDRRHEWPAAKAFAADLARKMAAESPRLYTATLAKSARRGRIFIDYLRNERGSTAVAAYSIRSRPGAPVAMPVTWEEVTEALEPGRYTSQSVPDLVEGTSDPWAGISSLRQRLPTGKL